MNLYRQHWVVLFTKKKTFVCLHVITTPVGACKWEMMWLFRVFPRFHGNYHDFMKTKKTRFCFIY